MGAAGALGAADPVPDERRDSRLARRGGAVLSVDFQVGTGPGADQSVLYVPLPGVDASPKLAPRGLTVKAAPARSGG
jgi:hypothetical protein